MWQPTLLDEIIVSNGRIHLVNKYGDTRVLRPTNVSVSSLTSRAHPCHRLPADSFFLSFYTVFQKKTSTHIIGYKLRNSSMIFTALHVMQMRSSDENSVRLSVRLSVTRVYCDKTVERSVQIFIPYERTFSLVFWEEEWLVGGDLFYLKFWVNWPALEKNRRFSTNNRS